uniref:TEF transcription factor, PAR bZIP family member b n=1 Tax=Gouania willdenowi TaxID=441366 RepID=A0A8C5G718_GOUWI
MPGKAAVVVALQAKDDVATAAPQKSFPFVLKKIMDIPPPNILEEGDDEKEKLCSSEDVEEGGGVAASAGGGSRGGGGGASSGSVSASLTPAIWEKTIPYDGETFHLEYMDLDEFLLENGIPVSLEEEELQRTLSSVEGKTKPLAKVVPAPATTTNSAALTPDAPVAAVSESTQESLPDSPDPEEPVTVTTLQPRNTPSPIDPDAIEVDIHFQPDPTDLVLSSVPGGELFNPRKHKFSDEELKPQKKNNLAAKRSRDARRLKENQITVRASFLERENAALRQQVLSYGRTAVAVRTILARYEAKYGHPVRRS